MKDQPLGRGGAGPTYADLLMRLLGPAPLPDWPLGAAAAGLTIAALIVLALIDAATSNGVTVGSFGALLVLVASLGLSARLTALVAVTAIAARFGAVAMGGMPAVTGAAQALAIAAMGVVGYLAATATRSARGLAQLRQEVLARRSAELEELLGTAQAMAQTSDLQTLADRIVRSTAAILGAGAAGGSRRAAFVTVEDGRAVRVAAYDESELEQERAELPLEQHEPLREVIRTRRPQSFRTSLVRGPLKEDYDRLGVTVVSFAPVCIADQVVGGLSFSSRATEPLQPSDLRLLEAMANLAGFAMHRFRLLQEAERTAARLRIALDVASDLGASLDLRKVIDLLVKRAVEAVDADRCTLSTVDDDEIVVEATYDRSAASTWGGLRYPLAMARNQPLFWRALESQKPVIGGRLEVESAAPELQDALRPVRQTAIMPLVLGGAVRAVLVFSRRTARAFQSDDLITLQLFGNVAVLALRNARLFGDLAVSKEAADRHARRVRTVLEVGVDLAAAPHPHQLVRRLLERTMAAVDADRVALMRLEADALVVEGSQTVRGVATPPGARFPIRGQTEARQAIERRQPIVTGRPDLAALPENLRRSAAAVRHSVVIPLASVGPTEQVLAISRERDVPFDADDVSMLQLLGNVAGLALRNAHLLEEAMQASRAKTDFLNMAGHELRTPLAVIKGYLSMIEDGTFGRPSDAWRGPIEIVAAKLVELDNLVNEVLTAARLESGRFPVRLESIDVREAILTAVRRAQPRAELLKARVSTELPASPVAVTADAEQLGRILDNLINNALTYSDGPPEVTVGVERGAPVRVLVRDRGIGIDQEFHERIFERFYRIDAPETRRPAGTGLGLSISRELASLMGATLFLAWSEPGKGSVFELDLESAAEPAHAAAGEGLGDPSAADGLGHLASDHVGERADELG